MDLYIVVTEVDLRVKSRCTRDAAVRSFRRFTRHHRFGRSYLYLWVGKGPPRLLLSKVDSEYISPPRPAQAAA